jgi:hypothetical protein
VIEILREAHQATAEARAGGEPAADADLLAKLRQRYDEAIAFGITHNRHRDWHDGNHPGYALGCWLRDTEPSWPDPASRLTPDTEHQDRHHPMLGEEAAPNQRFGSKRSVVGRGRPSWWQTGGAVGGRGR